MTPKVPVATITGTMASPSSPSVRFTALPKPHDDEGAEGDEEDAEIEDVAVDEGQGEPRGVGRADRRHGPAGDERDQRLEARRAWPEKPSWVCFVTLR